MTTKTTVEMCGESENVGFVCALGLPLAIPEEAASTPISPIATVATFPEHYEYVLYRKDKFTFRVPKDGFWFTENDCWVYLSGNVARVGVTDFVQQTLSDIMFVEPPDWLAR